MKKKTRTIFRYLLIPLFILAIAESVLFYGAYFVGQVPDHLKQNARDIVNQKVINRSEYLQNEMVRRWSSLANVTEYINTTAEKLAEEGKIDFETLDLNSGNAIPLLTEILGELINSMRTLRVTGIYVIFSNEDLDQGLEDKTGIYIRDADPLSGLSSDNGDLLLEYAPIDLAASSGITTDTYWRPCFEFGKRQCAYPDFFYVPYQQARHNEKNFSAADMGYWGKNFVLNESNVEAITYSVPLLNSEGHVYGVVGIDLALPYLRKLLPEDELTEDSAGSYLLAVHSPEGLILENIFSTGYKYNPDSNTTELKKSKDMYTIDFRENNLYASVKDMRLYNSNTPYSDEKWALVGIVDTKDLYAFADRINRIFMLVFILVLMLGVVCSLIVSYYISRPIKKLSAEMETSRKDEPIRLGRTYIAEIDHLARKTEQFNQDILNNAAKFSRILKLASIEMASFEYNVETGSIYLSDNFFELFMEPERSVHGITLHDIREAFKVYNSFLIKPDFNKNEYLYRLPDGEGYRYIKMKQIVNGSAYIGTVENVTKNIMEKNAIEYERDHDALTGLIGRGAFNRIMKKLFEETAERIRTAALVMLDLDNLKTVNDTYGHEYGDRYIKTAADCFLNNTPKHTIVSRISGDEFYLFYYGYSKADEVRTEIQKLSKALNACAIELPDKTKYPICASGGIAWYPQNTTSLKVLQKYADHAMYQAKRSGRNHLEEFSQQDYIENSYLLAEKKEFQTILREGAISFFFQPIVDCRDGSILGYEALMRPQVSILKSPSDVLRIARQMGQLEQIEILTWFRSMETYNTFRKDGTVPETCYLFINSISNQVMPSRLAENLEQMYPDLLNRVVLEVTESEMVNKEYHVRKEKRMAKWNAAVAVDDYGSGYNGDMVILFIAPQYIKVDMEIIRSIDTNPDKRRIMKNIVEYAHEKDMKIISEGVETLAELECVMKLGTDYVQGYFLAKPQAVPAGISPVIRKVIQDTV